MATDVTLPQLGESVTEGTVTRWLKQVGDSVEVDEPLLEVSTDKVDTEIPSPIAGTLLEIKADEDETIEVGAVLAVVGDSDESSAGESSGSGDGADEQPAESSDDGEQSASDEGAEQASGDGEEQQAESSEDGADQDEQTPAASEVGESTQDSQPTEEPAADAPAPQADVKPAGGGGTDVTLPQLGESVTEGTVTRWLKKVGDSVEVDEPLLEVSTDKVDTEIPSPIAGTLLEIKADEDETVEVGGVLAVVGDASDSAGGGSDVAGDSSDSAGGAGDSAGSEVEAPPTQPTDSGDVADESGAPQTESEPLAEPEAEQEAPEPESAPEPAAKQQEPEAEQQPEPETQTQAAPSGSSQPTASDGGGHSSSSSGDSPSYVTPLVRKLAAQHDVDLSGLIGTGVGGRIRKQDVLAAAEAAKQSAEPEAAVAPVAQASSSPAPSSGTSDLRGKRQKMSRLRKTIAKRMVESLQTSAQLTTVVEIDVTGIGRLRNRVKDQFLAREGVKLSYMPFFAKAAVEALKSFPMVNATIDEETLEIIYHDTENLAIAVDTERGLLTPVIKEAGDLNIAGLARRIADVADRTRDNKIKPDDLFGGTFTLTNTGSVGALFDTPIINMPQVAILGTGSVVKRAVVIDDPNLGETIAIRQMVYFALTYDHRLVDGADAARFLGAVKVRLEEAAFEGDLGL
jgi:2-oxoglutarate dehydrogenase E2 component (dihydrolipoamide succinyltransferase)